MDIENDETLVRETWLKATPPRGKLPPATDIVIIGGGIVGVSTAWFLARQGVNVVLCEKGHIAGEQSGRNWGWVRQQGRDLRELPMMIESIALFDSLEKDLGEDVGFVRGGCLFTANEEKDIDAFHDWMKLSQEFNLDTRIVDRLELDKLINGAQHDWLGAMYTASDGRAEPHKTAPAIARGAARAGATILEGCAVRGLETSGGNVSAVVTEQGTVKASTVLCAGGAWTSTFCRSLDIALPQLRVRGTVARTAPAEELLAGNLFDKRLGIRKRADGGYTVAHGSILDHSITPSTFRYAFKFIPALMQEISVLRLRFGRDFFDELALPRKWALDEASPFEKNRVLDPAPSQRVLRGIRRNLDRMFPGMRDVPIVEAWAGMVETSPDVVPIINQTGKLPGFYVATGFSGHGFGIGPGAGKAIAAMLTGADCSIDLKPFRLERFFDGSPIRPMPTL